MQLFSTKNLNLTMTALKNHNRLLIGHLFNALQLPQYFSETSSLLWLYTPTLTPAGTPGETVISSGAIRGPWLRMVVGLLSGGEDGGRAGAERKAK